MRIAPAVKDDICIEDGDQSNHVNPRLILHTQACFCDARPSIEGEREAPEIAFDVERLFDLAQFPTPLMSRAL
nr:hypothetical protein [Mesorhizobium sp.]